VTGRVRGVIDSISRLLAQPDEELGRWGRALKNLILFAIRAGQELMDDRAPQMAAALSYRTVFSLIPVLVLSLVGLRAFYGGDSLDSAMDELLEYFGLSEIAIEQAGESALVGPPPEGAVVVQGERESVGDWVRSLVERVEGLNFAAIGAVGALILIYAALALLFEIERAFNIIYDAPRGRRTIGRIVNYWAVLTLGPIGVLSSFYVGQRFADVVENIGGSSLLSGLGVVFNFIISWLLLTLAYTIIPNTRVSKQPALTGAFIAALLWEAGKWGFTTYLEFSTGYARLYGSLALIPIFLLWIYITWWVVLFGLEMSYAMQTLDITKQRYRGSSARERSLVDSGACLAALVVIGRRFEAGEVSGVSDIGSELGVGESVAANVAGLLVESDLVRRVEGDGDESSVGRLTLARPPVQIRLDDVVSLGHRLAVGDHEASDGPWAALRSLRDAEMRTASSMTLADVIHENVSP